jgi:hypothetical protein
VVIGNMGSIDLYTDKMLQLLTKSMSDVDEDSDEDEGTVEPKEENKDTEEDISSEYDIEKEVKDRMNNFHTRNDKTIEGKKPQLGTTGVIPDM